MGIISLDEYKESIDNTSLQTLLIKREDLYTLYPQIGYGCEGSVHKYNDLVAFKIFMFFQEKERLPNKYKKIEAMSSFMDESFCFPHGLIGFEDGEKEGYYTDLIQYNNKLKDFEHLQFLKDTKKLIEYLVKADAAIERIHKMGFVIGDVKGDNIMIDTSENPRFVDVDNYAFGDYDFDVFPGRRSWFKKVFGKDCSNIDSDKYLYAMMCIQYFAFGTLLHLARTPQYFKTLIKLIDVDSESKDILELIFSDAEDKPYMGTVLKKINPDQRLFRSEDIQQIRRMY